MQSKGKFLRRRANREVGIIVCRERDVELRMNLFESNLKFINSSFLASSSLNSYEFAICCCCCYLAATSSSDPHSSQSDDSQMSELELNGMMLHTQETRWLTDFGSLSIVRAGDEFPSFILISHSIFIAFCYRHIALCCALSLCSDCFTKAEISSEFMPWRSFVFKLAIHSAK